VKCPACPSELVHCKNEFGNFWHCGDCGGTAVALPVLKKFVAQDTLNALWRGVKEWDHLAHRSCPGCKNKMEEVPVNVSSGRLLIDICEVCQFIWMDAGEWDALPNAEKTEDLDESGLSPGAREILVEKQSRRIRGRAELDKRYHRHQAHEALWDAGSGVVGRLIEGIFDTFG